MFLSTLLSLFTARPAYVWRPAVTLDDPRIVSALMPDCAR
jgi:hypothetical protein